MRAEFSVFSRLIEKYPVFGRDFLMHFLLHLFGKKARTASLFLLDLSFFVHRSFQTFRGRTTSFRTAGRGREGDQQQQNKRDETVFFHKN